MNKQTEKRNDAIELFKTIEKYKEENKNLTLAFKDYAVKHNKKPNSVRNFYYLQLNLLKTNKDLANFYGINTSKHNVAEVHSFSSKDEENLLISINELVSKGFSVRGACLKLSNGDISEMIRYQNKYRCLIKKKQQEQNLNNVIKMPEHKTKIADSDIEALFLGLVKLVKKSAVEEYKNKIDAESKENIANLKKYKIDLEEKEKEIQNLRSKISLFSEQNDILKEELNCLKISTAQSKSKEIKNFFNSKLIQNKLKG